MFITKRKSYSRGTRPCSGQWFWSENVASRNSAGSRSGTEDSSPNCLRFPLAVFEITKWIWQWLGSSHHGSVRIFSFFLTPPPEYLMLWQLYHPSCNRTPEATDCRHVGRILIYRVFSTRSDWYLRTERPLLRHWLGTLPQVDFSIRLFEDEKRCFCLHYHFIFSSRLQEKTFAILRKIRKTSLRS